ncbi:protein of unknown function [Methylacidimicrobium sp. AP8]|uniref:hypothetical protein n=1 Tax=Methylacidimicrobium sp. AP8 TaxID=2730359 RepID=UPI0018C04E25|nr:hypothetical protein [Methylacidimicrobium sp. AP8]CAB4243372.1 protein of unknown function [Methylacidimicrobium sp. AP8]
MDSTRTSCYQTQAALRLICLFLVLVLGEFRLRAEGQAEGASPKADLAALVQKRTLSNEELLSLVKTIATWPLPEFNKLPGAFNVPFTGGLQGQYPAELFNLHWGAPYYCQEHASMWFDRPSVLVEPPRPAEAAPLFPMDGPLSAGLVLGRRFEAAVDDPDSDRKGAVLEIIIYTDWSLWKDSRGRLVFTRVNLAFRKGRVSLREADVIRAWGKPSSSQLESHEDTWDRNVPYSEVEYDPSPGSSDTGTKFCFYTASSEEVPLEVEILFRFRQPKPPEELRRSHFPPRRSDPHELPSSGPAASRSPSPAP